MIIRPSDYLKASDEFLEFAGTKQDEGGSVFGIDLQTFLPLAFFTDFDMDWVDDFVSDLPSAFGLKIQKDTVVAITLLKPNIP